MPRTWLKLAIFELAEDGNNIAPVDGDCSNIEYASNGDVRPEPNKINSDAQRYGDPHSVDGSPSQRVDLSPDARAGEQTIARAGKDRSCEGLL